jgi:hypothetical protein
MAELVESKDRLMYFVLEKTNYNVFIAIVSVNGTYFLYTFTLILDMWI